MSLARNIDSSGIFSTFRIYLLRKSISSAVEIIVEIFCLSVNKKSKKIKKLKKGRDERMKGKKKHRPGLTAEDVLRIRQESGRQSTYEQEEVISEERIEEHLE